jgi:hypothetical protein
MFYRLLASNLVGPVEPCTLGVLVSAKTALCLHGGTPTSTSGAWGYHQGPPWVFACVLVFAFDFAS